MLKTCPRLQALSKLLKPKQSVKELEHTVPSSRGIVPFASDLRRGDGCALIPKQPAINVRTQELPHDGEVKKQAHHQHDRRGKKKPQSSQRRRKKTQQDLEAISKFFSQYPRFSYDQKRGVSEEYYRMCDFFNWDKYSDERRKAHQAFKDSMVIRFNGLYGTDVTDLENWHKLCVAVHIEPLPATISKCRERISDIHVNIVDLVDDSGRDVELFTCLDGLKDYTIKTGKFFPKESAYAGGVLKFLLREILSCHWGSLETQR